MLAMPLATRDNLANQLIKRRARNPGSANSGFPRNPAQTTGWSAHEIRHLLRAPAAAPVGRGRRAAGCSRTRSTRSNWPTGSASTTPGRSSTTSSRNTRTPRRRRSSSPPARSAPSASASATASCLMPPNYNHPARVAERIATLDLVSNGRVEFGTGESASRLELGGFNGVDPVEKRRDVAGGASSSAPT